MARKYLKAAAAHARAQRAAQHLVLTQDGHLAHEQNSFDSGSDSDSDVGYVGGVNCDGSDSDDTEDWNDSGSESSSSFSELEGTDLENNLKELREEAKDLKGTMSSLERLHLPKSTSYWRKAESNRALGYTGTSQRTQRQRAKNARERAVSRDEARSS